MIDEREALRRQARPVPEAAFARARGDHAFQGARRPTQLVGDDNDHVAARRLERRAGFVEHDDVRVAREASHELRERLAAPNREAGRERRPLGRGARDAAREVPRGLLREESPPRQRRAPAPSYHGPRHRRARR